MWRRISEFNTAQNPRNSDELRELYEKLLEELRKRREKYKDLSFMANVIGRCDVYNVEIDKNGYITVTIIDYYDFDKNNMSFIPRNAYIQQQNGHLVNYALMIPIRIKMVK